MIPALRRPDRGRTFGSGLGRALTTVALAATLAAGVAACGGSSTKSASPKLPEQILPNGKKSAIGAPPAYLNNAAKTDQTLQGTAAKPGYAAQGDVVDVHIGSDAVATTRVSGPGTPPDGQVPEPETIPETFKVSITPTKGDVKLDVSQWTVRTGENGRLYRATMAKGSTMPAEVKKGHTANFTLLVPKIVSGEGVVQWSPGDGKKVLAVWDYIAEID